MFLFGFSQIARRKKRRELLIYRRTDRERAGSVFVNERERKLSRAGHRVPSWHRRYRVYALRVFTLYYISYRSEYVAQR